MIIRLLECFRSRPGTPDSESGQDENSDREKNDTVLYDEKKWLFYKSVEEGNAFIEMEKKAQDAWQNRESVT